MPFKSKAQARACFAQKDSNWDCEEWAEKTDFSRVPEKKKEKGSKSAGLLPPLHPLPGGLFRKTPPGPLQASVALAAPSRAKSVQAAPSKANVQGVWQKLRSVTGEVPPDPPLPPLAQGFLARSVEKGASVAQTCAAARIVADVFPELAGELETLQKTLSTVKEAQGPLVTHVPGSPLPYAERQQQLRRIPGTLDYSPPPPGISPAAIVHSQGGVPESAIRQNPRAYQLHPFLRDSSFLRFLASQSGAQEPNALARQMQERWTKEYQRTAKALAPVLPGITPGDLKLSDYMAQREAPSAGLVPATTVASAAAERSLRGLGTLLASPVLGAGSLAVSGWSALTGGPNKGHFTRQFLPLVWNSLGDVLHPFDVDSFSRPHGWGEKDFENYLVQSNRLPQWQKFYRPVLPRGYSDVAARFSNDVAPTIGTITMAAPFFGRALQPLQRYPWLYRGVMYSPFALGAPPAYRAVKELSMPLSPADAVQRIDPELQQRINDFLGSLQQGNAGGMVLGQPGMTPIAPSGHDKEGQAPGPVPANLRYSMMLPPAPGGLPEPSPGVPSAAQANPPQGELLPSTARPAPSPAPPPPRSTAPAPTYVPAPSSPVAAAGSSPSKPGTAPSAIRPPIVSVAMQPPRAAPVTSGWPAPAPHSSSTSPPSPAGPSRSRAAPAADGKAKQPGLFSQIFDSAQRTVDSLSTRVLGKPLSTLPKELSQKLVAQGTDRLANTLHESLRQHNFSEEFINLVTSKLRDSASDPQRRQSWMQALQMLENASSQGRPLPMDMLSLLPSLGFSAEESTQVANELKARGAFGGPLALTPIRDTLKGLGVDRWIAQFSPIQQWALMLGFGSLLIGLLSAATGSGSGAGWGLGGLLLGGFGLLGPNAPGAQSFDPMKKYYWLLQPQPVQAAR